MQETAGYRIVKLANGTHSVHSLAERETFHPVIGPVAEAEALYVKQLRLPERLANHAGEFVIWDVGLGAAANVLTVLRATHGTKCPLRILSFDRTLEPLAFALDHAGSLGYFTGYENAVRELLDNGELTFADSSRQVSWQLHLGDFPTWLEDSPMPARTEPTTPNRSSRREEALTSSPYPPNVRASSRRLPPMEGSAAPHAILFDAYSPARNPAMWTQPLFANILRRLDPARPCALPTYSRSTMLRVSLLLAGFFVGAGHATGEKEETTIAANTPDLIAEPLDRKWLNRARKSTSAEPLWEPHYRQAPLSEQTWEKLQEHPQFTP